MGGSQSAPEGELTQEQAAIRAQILADGPVPTSEGQYQVQLELCIADGTTGTLFVDVHPSWSPRGEARFRELMEAGWYDGCKFFRVVPGFMVQFGLAAEPAKFGRQEDIPDDPVLAGNVRGRISFAHAGPNTRTNQLFINTVDNSVPGFRPYALDDKGFSAFAQVCETRGGGMALVDQINKAHGEGPDQGRIAEEGNAYLDAEFPGLSYIVSMRLADSLGAE